MRNAQVGIFIIGIVLFILSALFIGQQTGDALWRAGVAALMVDVTAAKLWPSTQNR